MSKEYQIKDIQAVILSIIKDVDDFCQKNDIQYYLMGGSALGAMRHHGFIPWDDDLDIFMTYDQYHKFLDKFEKYGDKDKYFLQKENTEEWPLFLSRVCLNGTTMISDEFKNNMKQHHNVFIDIMCLYSAPSNVLLHRVQYVASQMLRVNALAKCEFPNDSIIKRVALKLSKGLVNPVTRPILIKGVSMFEGEDTELVGHYFGRARFSKTSFPRAFIGKPRYVPFEDTRLPVFENVEDYLKMRYGEKWMDMPSKVIRDSYPIHGNFVDLENDYTSYMNSDHTLWEY